MKRGIVIDIDENIVHSVVREYRDITMENVADFSFKMEGIYYYVFKRPYLDQFISKIFGLFDYIGFWTVGVATYAKNVLKKVLTLEQAKSPKMVFIHTRMDCPRDFEGNYYKPLSKVCKDFGDKFNNENTIVMDNTYTTMQANVKNGLLTPSYEIDNLFSDTYLYWLTNKMEKYLHKLSPLEFVKQFSYYRSTR
jgi:TFIIF-interacting CTD phosphatase-like protein